MSPLPRLPRCPFDTPTRELSITGYSCARPSSSSRLFKKPQLCCCSTLPCVRLSPTRLAVTRNRTWGPQIQRIVVLSFLWLLSLSCYVCGLVYAIYVWGMLGVCLGGPQIQRLGALQVSEKDDPFVPASALQSSNRN